MNARKRKKARRAKNELRSLRPTQDVQFASENNSISGASSTKQVGEVEANENYVTLDLSNVKNFDKSITNILKEEFDL